MGRQDRIDFYRNSRDFGSLLDGDGGEADEGAEEEDDFIVYDDDEERLDDFIDYDDEDGGQEPEEAPQEEAQDEPMSEEVLEYLSERERLKEIERQRLRQKLNQSASNGKGSSSPAKRPLPLNNYGSFFGPSEPVVSKRVIEDKRAREEAMRIARLAKQQEMAKKQTGASKNSSDTRAPQMMRPPKPINEAALKAKRLKEARDYSFLFSDEDPSTSAPRDGYHGAAVKHQDHDRQKLTSSGKPTAGSSVRPPLPNSGVKLTKPNVSTQHKGLQPKPQLKPPPTKPQKPPERPLERPNMAKVKLPPQTVASSNLHRSSAVQHSSSSKPITVPGRQAQPQSRPSVVSGSNGKGVSASTVAQLKNIVASKPRGPDPRQMPPARKPDPLKQGKPPLPQRPSSADLERKLVTSSTTRPDQKRPALADQRRPGLPEQRRPSLPDQRKPSLQDPRRTSLQDPRRASLQDQRRAAIPDQRRPGQPTAGYLDQRRPPQSGTPVKQGMRPPAKPMSKKRSHDPFADDDDDDPISAIRKMFGYNPNKYHDEDDDDRNMEADFRTIQMEERRSAKIAKEEDDRELALIEAEERAERERARKKRKLQGK